jgi:hypothetical protein
LYAVNALSLRIAVRSIVALSLCLAGCSLLVDAGRDQCSSADDCERIGLPGSCEQGVCVASKARGGAVGAGGAGSPSRDSCDGGACGGADASMPVVPNGACRQDGDCTGDQRCYKDACQPAELVAPFLCGALAPGAGASAAAPQPAMNATVHFTLPAREFVSDMPPKGLKASACRVNDLTCAAPVATFEDTDGKGNIELDLPYAFVGFLDVRSDDTLPALWYFTQPLTGSLVYKNLGMVAPSTLELLAAIAGYESDTSKGLVVLEAFDCNKKATGGIHFEQSKSGGLPFFIIDSTPSAESTVTVRDDATDTASGGFLNATPGFTVFTARIGVDGPVLGEFNALVRANTVTYLDIYP